MSRFSTFPVAAVALVILAGCSSAPNPSAPHAGATGSPGPSASANGSPRPTSAQALAVQPLVIPGCETMLPLALAQSLFSPTTQFLGEVSAPDYGGRFDIPAIHAAQLGSVQSTLCHWGVPNSDGSFALVVAEIGAPDRASLISALGGAGFSSVTTGTVTTLELERDGVVSTESGTHLFTGDLWIWCDGTGLGVSGPVAASALAAARLANPSRGF